MKGRISHTRIEELEKKVAALQMIVEKLVARADAPEPAYPIREREYVPLFTQWPKTG